MAAYISFQPSDFFSTTLYEGNSSTNAITGVGFQPDFTWIKNYNAAASFALQDAARGNDRTIRSNNDGVGYTNSFFDSFDSDGFTVSTSENDVNASGDDFVAWNWKGGTTSGIATNGSTTITPTAYSFNQTSGFSVVKYTGNTTSGAKVAHGLGATPTCIMTKNLNSAENWFVYFVTTTNGKYLLLDANSSTTTSATAWNDTDPDSVNFTLGSSAQSNGTSMVAYCFAPKKGFSKMGGYYGNGVADGPFIYTGFRPAFIMCKKTNGAANWHMYDNKRSVTGFNVIGGKLVANENDAQAVGTECDFVSNGVKIRASGSDLNEADYQFVYIAFAEFPFVSSNSKAGVAR